MIPLYTQEQFSNARYNDKLPLQCTRCDITFYKEKEQITQALKPNPKKKLHFCSLKCAHESFKVRIDIPCATCGKIVNTTKSRLSVVKNKFCSRKCNGIHLIKYRKYGYNRSKLESWIENHLTVLYPNLEIIYNDTTAITHELDIYIPSLSLAFELNGIFHYEPIFGNKRLNSAQKNDISKSKACIDNQIDLCVIDTTSQKYFKESTSHKFLDIITSIINQRTI